MENKYRESLRKAKENHGLVHPLYQSSWSYLANTELRMDKSELSSSSNPNSKPELNTTKTTITNLDIKSSIPTDSEKKQVTEKTIILDSLNVFGDEKLKDKEQFNFPGGELARKENTGVSREIENLSPQDAKNRFNELLGDRFVERRFKDISIVNIEPKKIIFVTDDTIDELMDVEEHLEPFSVYFNSDVSNLFHRMVSAMNLKASDYVLASVQIKSVEQLELLYCEIYNYKPELIITLGAHATHSVLNTKERLKDIHGQVQSIKLINQDQKNLEFSVMPLFSPSLLQTAPNMKKTAWKDMQKAMVLLGLDT